MDLAKLKADLARQKEENDAAAREIIGEIVAGIKSSDANEALKNVVAAAREAFRKDRR